MFAAAEATVAVITIFERPCATINGASPIVSSTESVPKRYMVR